MNHVIFLAKMRVICAMDSYKWLILPSSEGMSYLSVEEEGISPQEKDA